MIYDLQFFGGRGAGGGGGLPTVIPSGNGSPQGRFGNFPNTENPETLKDAMGNKGRPMSVVNAAAGANPYYDGSYSEFSENCQRAVVAYELRRRGYDVTAQPTFQNDKLPQQTVNGRAYYQGAFQKTKVDNVGASNGNKVSINVDNKMAEYSKTAENGNSRAMLQISWRNGGGHVISVEHKNGKTEYIDPQIGARYKAKELFDKVKPKSVKLIRVDNKRVSERAKKSVEIAGKRTNSK